MHFHGFIGSRVAGVLNFDSKCCTKLLLVRVWLLNEYSCVSVSQDVFIWVVELYVFNFMFDKKICSFIVHLDS